MKLKIALIMLIFINYSYANDNISRGVQILNFTFGKEYAKSMTDMLKTIKESGQKEWFWVNNFHEKSKLTYSEIEKKFGKADSIKENYHYFDNIALVVTNNKVISAQVQYRDYSNYFGPLKSGLSFNYGISTIEFYNNGKQIGIERRHPKGESEISGNIINGKYIHWEDYGQSELNWENGGGNLIKFYVSGNKQKVMPFKNGVWHGTGLDYRDNKSLKQITPVVNGVIHGNVVFYNSTGNINKEIKYIKGVPQKN
jgi:antitoxin component YwqK of YwqJK toxin-antitoxin module